MPEKLITTPFRYEDIVPISGKLKIIDNYSPTFNYIVDGPKVYYSKKGQENWRDISDRENARRNLLNFLNEKYQFRGYGQDVKDIYDQVLAGTFNYDTYWDNMYNAPSVSTVEKKPVVLSTALDPNNVSEEPAFKVPFGLYEWDGNLSPGPIYGHYGTKDKTPKSDPTPSRSIKDVIGTAKQSVRDFIINTAKQSSNDDIVDLGGVMEQHGVLGGINYMGQRAIDNIVQKHNAAKETQESILEDPYEALSDEGHEIIPGSYTGERTSGISRRIPTQYITPESINVSEHLWGVRNNGDYTPIQSEAAAITNFYPYQPLTREQLDSNSITLKDYYGRVRTFENAIGIDSEGHLKAGPISIFNEGDLVSPTFANEIYNFVKDENGNYVVKADFKHGNPENIPQVITYDDKLGTTRSGFGFNVLLGKNDNTGNIYAGNRGGRYLVRVGDELRLLSGSVKNIEAEFEAMKRRQGVDHGTFYNLDNGYYNKGLRTTNGRFTESDLRNYEKAPASGHFAYISGNVPQQFETDTLLSPNIRTQQSASYRLKGHPLTNEQQGVVLHYTASPNFDSTKSIFMKYDEDRGVSSHVVIDKDGRRTIFARPDQVAFHAGKSRWNGRDDVNDFMLGIEFEAAGPNVPLTQEQIDSAIEWLRPIVRDNKIPLSNIVTHKMVADEYIKAHPEEKVRTKQDLSYAQYKQILDALIGSVYTDTKKSPTQ